MATYPVLLALADETAYRIRFETLYCRDAITTFDGIQVRFRKTDFDHCFFESSRRDRVKDTFSKVRAERLEWILVALQDATADRFIGWDRNSKTYDKHRRITLVCGSYLVVIALKDATNAIFVTAYVADTLRSLNQIRKSPKWTT